MKRKLGVLVILALLMAGCANYERVMVPPKVSIGPGKSVAVLFFDNLTDEYTISYEVEQQLVRTLGGYYRVLEPAETEWALVRLGLLRGEMPNSDQAIRLGQMLGVDAIVFGEVSSYYTPITQTPPYIIANRTNPTSGKRENRWELMQNTRVMLSFTARVVNTHSGNMVHRQRVEGESARDRKVALFDKWLPDGQKPSAFFLPKPDRFDIPDQTKYALRQAVEQFSADLLPTYVWLKIEGE